MYKILVNKTYAGYSAFIRWYQVDGTFTDSGCFYGETERAAQVKADKVARDTIRAFGKGE